MVPDNSVEAALYQAKAANNVLSHDLTAALRLLEASRHEVAELRADLAKHPHQIAQELCDRQSAQLRAERDLLRITLKSWVDVMDQMALEPDDPAAEIREQYHGKRLLESKRALAITDPDKPPGEACSMYQRHLPSDASCYVCGMTEWAHKVTK